MKKHYYTLKDATGSVVKTFKTWKEANEYKFVYGNSGWFIC